MTEQERQELIARLDRMASSANMLARLYEDAARTAEKMLVKS